MKAHAADAAAKKRKKGPAFHDFQLFDRERLNAIAEKERQLAAQKEDQIKLISDLRARASQSATGAFAEATPGSARDDLLRRADDMEKKLVGDFQLSPEDQNLKTSLQAEGFPDWNKKDFKSFCTSMERHGRYDFAGVVRDVGNETGKDEKEIARYFAAFWINYRRIQDWNKVLEKIIKGEKKILRLRQIRDAIQEKAERHLEDVFGPQFADLKEGGKVPSPNELLEHSWSKMKINYGSGTKGRAYQEEEDAFLVAMMYRHGYGAAERIRMEIRRAWQFRFDWYFKSRNALEIQKRCDLLVKLIEKENEDIRKKMISDAAIRQQQQQQQAEEAAAARPDLGLPDETPAEVSDVEPSPLVNRGVAAPPESPDATATNESVTPGAPDATATNESVTTPVPKEVPREESAASTPESVAPKHAVPPVMVAPGTGSAASGVTGPTTEA